MFGIRNRFSKFGRPVHVSGSSRNDGDLPNSSRGFSRILLPRWILSRSNEQDRTWSRPSSGRESGVRKKRGRKVQNAMARARARARARCFVPSTKRKRVRTRAAKQESERRWRE